MILKNYAGNLRLIKYFKSSDCEKMFPTYGADVRKNVERGILLRKLFDKSAVLLSDCLPNFNRTHLIVKDISDCLTKNDLKIFSNERPSEHSESE